MQNYQIPPSELIITAAGCVYHLDLHPDELAATIITVGDPARVAQVSKHFDRIEVKKQHREFVSHTGYIGAKRISVVSTGIGPDNIDIVLNELDALVNIDFTTRTIKPQLTKLKIIRLGTSGTVQAHIPVDSMVASSFGLGMDNLMHYYQYQENELELQILQAVQQQLGVQHHSKIQPYLVQGSVALLNHFIPTCFHGITMTAPGFYGPQGRVLRLPLAFPNWIDQLGDFECQNIKITNIEMETSAIYGLGSLLGHQCLSINTIIANRAQQTFSADPGSAVEQMIQKSIAIIADLA